MMQDAEWAGLQVRESQATSNTQVGDIPHAVVLDALRRTGPSTARAVLQAIDPAYFRMSSHRDGRGCARQLQRLSLLGCVRVVDAGRPKVYEATDA